MFQSIMNVFAPIANFFKSMFGNVPVRAAKLAGLFVADNNKAKVTVLLPFAKAALLTVQKGKMDVKEWNKFFDGVLMEVDNPKLKLILSEFVNYPEFTLGKVNEDAVALLDAFILGLEAGV